MEPATAAATSTASRGTRVMIINATLCINRSRGNCGLTNCSRLNVKLSCATCARSVAMDAPNTNMAAAPANNITVVVNSRERAT